MEPTEYEFLAENQTVEINPKFTHGVMTFIQVGQWSEFGWIYLS